MTRAHGGQLAARTATALTRALLLAYPRSFRKEVGHALVGDVRSRAKELTASRGGLRVAAWLLLLAASLLINAVAAWGERIVPRRSSFSWLDLKLAFRMLVKYPGLTLTAGLGIAVAVAIGVGFVSFTQWRFHPTIPLSEGDRLVGLENRDRRTSKADRRSLYDFVAWRAEMKSVEDLSAFHTVARNVIANDGSVEPVQVAEITPSGFRLARVPPLLGRSLLEADAAPGAAPVIVIGFDVWRTRFLSDSDVVGRTIRLGATLHTVVGVMPEGFSFPVNHRFWTPLKIDSSGHGRAEDPAIYISGRLAPGFELNDAQAELTVIADRMAAEFPDTHRHLRPEVLPYAYPFAGMNRHSADAAIPMIVIFSLLLVVVCVNVAILIYARTTTRRGEIAVRAALGASRGRIVAQMFAESLVLSAAAAGAGVFVVALMLDWMDRTHRMAPFWTDYSLSGSALLYAATLTVLAAVITGVMPALQATGRRAQWNLGQVGSRSGMQLGRTWTTLIVVQVTVAVAAVPIAVALSWSQVRRDFTLPGFPVEQFLIARVGLAIEPSPGTEPSSRFARLRTELSRRLDAEPGAAGTAFTMDLPTAGSPERVAIDNEIADSAARSPHQAQRSTVDARFFRTFDVNVLAGRPFLPADQAEYSPDVVIVNRAFATQMLGDPLGRRIRYVPETPTDASTPMPQRWYDVVGVVENIDANLFDAGLTQPRVYHPMKDTEAIRTAGVAVRTAGINQISAGRLRELAAAIDPALVVEDVITLDDAYSLQRRVLIGATAGTAVALLSVLLLSAAGIYALVSFTVTERRREIAIRTALGAQPGRLLAGIFQQALKQISLGVALGITAALLLDGAERGEALQGYRAVLLPGMVVLMGVVGLLAALGPARRGLRIEPSEALKAE